MTALEATQPTSETKSETAPPELGFFRSLAGRLLALTMAFVLLAEVLIFIPSLAGFYLTWLRDRVDTAQIAVLAVEASPSGLHESLQAELLANAEVESVALLRNETRLLELSRTGGTGPAEANANVLDLRTITLGAAIRGALGTLVAKDTGRLRVVATPRLGSGERIEIVVSEAPMKRDLRRYASSVFAVSLAISLLTAAFVYLALVVVFVRPMQSLTSRIERFRAEPGQEARPERPSGRTDEIGRAETALAAMEQQVRASFRQRERLAGLGGAVARIAHDLRSGLATAQLLTERLAQSADPSVRQIAPRLERAIERASGLAQATLRYGKAEERAPEIVDVDVTTALQDAADDALAPYPGVEWRNAAPAGVVASADPEHLHRVFVNLLRNAAQALTAQSGRTTPGVIAATATQAGAFVLVRIVDDGPGVPAAVQGRLFEPFSGSKRADSTGLGLAIARELARAMGGDVALVATGAEGTAFEVRLASAPPPAV